MKMKPDVSQRNWLRAFGQYAGLVVLFVGIAGFQGCPETQVIETDRARTGQLRLPRVTLIKIAEAEGPGAEELTRSLKHELYHGIPYSVAQVSELESTEAQATESDAPQKGRADRPAFSTLGERTALLECSIDPRDQGVESNYKTSEEDGQTVYLRTSVARASMNVRFTDSQTGQFIASTRLTTRSLPRRDSVTQVGPPLRTRPAIEALFAPPHMEHEWRRGYDDLARQLGSKLQGYSEQVQVRLFVGDGLRGYDPIHDPSDLFRREDWVALMNSYQRALLQLETDKNEDATVEARLLANLATCSAVMGECDHSIQLYRRALKLEPHSYIEQGKAQCEEWIAKDKDIDWTLRYGL